MSFVMKKILLEIRDNTVIIVMRLAALQNRPSNRALRKHLDKDKNVETNHLLEPCLGKLIRSILFLMSLYLILMGE